MYKDDYISAFGKLAPSEEWMTDTLAKMRAAEAEQEAPGATGRPALRVSGKKHPRCGLSPCLQRAQCQAGGLLLGLLAAGAGGRELLPRGQGDLHGEVPGMFRAFTGQGRIDGAIVEKGHRAFLQTGLEILGLGFAHTDLVQKRPEDAGHDLLGRGIAAVFVHGGQHGFEHVAEHGVTAATALLLLAAPQAQQLVDTRFPVFPALVRLSYLFR